MVVVSPLRRSVDVVMLPLSSYFTHVIIAPSDPPSPTAQPVCRVIRANVITAIAALPDTCIPSLAAQTVQPCITCVIFDM